MTIIDDEEKYYYQKKDFRKERKKASKLDRSKYKKTDQKKRKNAFTSAVSENAIRARVLSVEGQRIIVEHKGKELECALKGRFKKELSDEKTLICVGDWVIVEPEGKQQGLIIAIEPRHSFLARSDPLKGKKHLIAVNIDIIFIVLSVVAPPLKPFLIDRYLIAAKKGKMKPILVINKIDLLQGHTEERILLEECIEIYENLGYQIIPVSVEKKKNLSHLKKAMQKNTSAFAGQSGVGKSSLLNAILGIDLPTAEIRKRTLKGKHTTSKATLVPLHPSGFCIDTPGIKSFGMWDISEKDVREHFFEFKPFADKCHYSNCKHIYEPSCLVKESVAKQQLSALRFESYQTIMEELQ